MIPIPSYEDKYAIQEDGAVIRIESGKRIMPSPNKQNGYLYVSLWKDNKGKTFSVHRLVANAYIPNPDNKPFVNHKNSNRADPSKDNLEWCTQSENLAHGYSHGFMSQEERRNFKEFEIELLLKAVLSGETLTALAKNYEVGLSRLTLHVRRKANELGLSCEYEAELTRQKKIRNTEANASKRKPILQYSLDGHCIAEYESATAAAKALGKSSSGSIANALNPDKDQSTAFGFVWKYK